MTTRVLVLDADTTFGGELRAHLNAKGLPTSVVSNGRAGLERALASKPRVVVLAAELPGMKGFRVCSRLRREAALGETKILMLYEAASRAAVREHQKIATRADSYLKKPVFVEELAARIERLESGATPKPRRTGRTVPPPTRASAPPPPRTPSRRPPPVPDTAALDASKKELDTAKKEQERLRKLLLERDSRLTALEKEARARKSSTSMPAVAVPIAGKASLLPAKDDPRLAKANARVKALESELADVKAELEGQRLLLDAQRQGPPSRVAAASQRDDRISALEQTENQMRSERDAALRRAEAAEQELSNFGRALDAVNGELEREKTAFRREKSTLEKRVASLQKDVEASREGATQAVVDEKVAAALQEASREHAKDVARLRGEQAAAVTLLKREITQLIGHKERADERVREIESVNATLRDEILVVRKDADARVDRLKGNQRVELEAAVLAAIERERRIAAEEETRRGQLAKTVNAEAEGGHKAEIAALQDQFAQTLSAQERRHSKELAIREEQLAELRGKIK